MGKIGAAVRFTDVMRIRRALVQDKLSTVARELISRGRTHDNSALGSPEIEVYHRFFLEYQKYKIGDPRKDEVFTQMAEAIGHHFQYNDHHPEHFENGINDMDLIRLMQFTADIMSWSEQEQIDIFEILPMIRDKCGMTDQVYNLICNTITEIKRLGR